MAYPGSYNFNYYQGDTLEFKVYPKTSTGASLPGLSGYTPKFTVATSRGTDATTIIPCYSRIVTDDGLTYVLCAITPDIILASGTWVYDVEISKAQESPYSLVYTLLTGNISVTQQVTSGTFAAPLATPGPVRNVSAVVAPSGGNTTVNVTWQAPNTGGAVENYYVTHALAGTPTVILGTATKTSSSTSHQVSGLQPNTPYTFGVYATNEATVGTPTSVTSTVTTLPNAPSIPTDVQLVDATNTTIEISWSAPTSGGQDGYIVELDGANVANLDSSTVSSYTFLGLTPGTTYTLGVRAANDGGQSEAAIVTAATDA
jgi:hypothetical protein